MSLVKEETMATLGFLLCTIPLTAALNLNEMIGTGRWTILKTTKCPENEMYPMQYEVSRKKVNRTHDGFNLYATLESPLDESYGGTYNVTDFVFNYNELPQRGIYGMYDATVYLLAPKNEDGVAKRMGCIVVTVNFENDS